MKTNLKIVLKVVFVCALKQLAATDSLDKVSKQLLQAGSIEANHALHEMREEATMLQQQAAEDIARLVDVPQKKQCNSKRTPTQHRAVREQDGDAKRALAAAEDIIHQRERLKKRTVQAISNIILRAEKEALGVRAEKRQAIMTEFFAASNNRKKMYWKYGLRDEYLNNLKELEAIVRQGESATEYQGLMASFSRQRTWFLATLEMIRKTTDKNYFLVFQKAQVLKHIITSFNSVAHMLTERLNQAGLAVDDMDKARLLALYDIQALISDKNQSDSIAQASSLSIRECGLVVDGLVNKIAAKKRIDDLMIEKKTMAQEVVVRNDMAQLSRDLAQREQAELSVAIGQARQEAAQAAVSVASDTALIPQNAVVAAVEKANKENAQLQVIVLGQEATIMRMKANSLATTKTAQQPLFVPAHPVSDVKTVEERERQARVVLESELQQKIIHG